MSLMGRTAQHRVATRLHLTASSPDSLGTLNGVIGFRVWGLGFRRLGFPKLLTGGLCREYIGEYCRAL